MYEGPIQDLIDELSRLPGIGPKSAQRLAFHLVKAPPDDAKRLAESIVHAKERIFFCKECGNVAEGDLCRICRDEGRDRTTLCVVEEPKDVSTIEKAGVIKGRYHVLGGAISPLDGIGPEDLRVQELLDRVQRDGVTEVILATNPNLEGNATAMYVAAMLKPFGVRVTRTPDGFRSAATYIAVALPSRFGLVAKMHSVTWSRSTRSRSSCTRRSSGPTPSSGLIAPPRMW